MDFCSSIASSAVSPAVSPKKRATPPAAADNRTSGSICNSTPLASALTVVVRKGHVASFPAVRAIVRAVRAELYVHLPLANGAVLFTVAVRFRAVALAADDRTRHGSLLENS